MYFLRSTSVGAPDRANGMCDGYARKLVVILSHRAVLPCSKVHIRKPHPVSEVGAELIRIEQWWILREPCLETPVAAVEANQPRAALAPLSVPSLPRSAASHVASNACSRYSNCSNAAALTYSLRPAAV